MLDKMRIAYFVHSLRSDWNNGNAHFLRGLVREVCARQHELIVFEPRMAWSMENLLAEVGGKAAIVQFQEIYPELIIQEYETAEIGNHSMWREALKNFDVIVIHEWNPPPLAHALLELRDELGCRILFHDTHHRTTSSPKQIQLLRVDRFDGVIAFGDMLRSAYRNSFGISKVWTLHEAADTTVFRPLEAAAKRQHVVWIGNWGDEERSHEIREFLLRPAEALQHRKFAAYGVRYPHEALQQLCLAKVRYGGYLSNLDAPLVYAESELTVHVPRQHYVRSIKGVPTIRVFEALACKVPLISAPWDDTEHLFREGDLTIAANGEHMREAIELMLEHPDVASEQASRGHATVLARHTCAHRAEVFEEICREVLQ